MKDRIPIIVGPTGVGKTEAAHRWVLETGAEVLSADAFQVYRGLPVGTAQPSDAFRREATYHLVGVRDPAEPWSAADFAREASSIVADVRARGKGLIIVGGSGFYIRALVEGIPDGTAPMPSERETVRREVERDGNDASWERLRKIDPGAAAAVDPHDTKRLRRALETVLYPRPADPSLKPLGAGAVRILGLDMDRGRLDGILRERCRRMWEGGLIGETRSLLDRGVPGTANIWEAIGYREAAAFAQGAVTRDEALDSMFLRTRRYAKRQRTWFRHHGDVRWVDAEGGLETVLQTMKEMT